MRPYNQYGIPLFEQAPRTGRPGHFSQAIQSHDYSIPETHYQKATQHTEVALSSGDQITYKDGSHVNWINIDHPRLFNQEIWTGAEYSSVRTLGGGYVAKSIFRPVVEVQVGGSGPWVVKAARDGGDATYDHNFDYAAGEVKFLSAIPGADNVRASFYKRNTDIAQKPSIFSVQPPAGKLWLVDSIELHLTEGCTLNDTTIFEKWINSIPFKGFFASYQSMADILATSRVQSRTQPANGGSAAVPPDVYNGYGVGYDGMRGLSLPVVTYVFSFNNDPFQLSGAAQESLDIYLANDQLITGAEKATFTVHADEEDE